MTGVVRKKKKLEQNSTGEAYTEINEDQNLQLSKPVNELIQDTFAEELNKLTNTPSEPAETTSTKPPQTTKKEVSKPTKNKRNKSKSPNVQRNPTNGTAVNCQQTEESPGLKQNGESKNKCKSKKTNAAPKKEGSLLSYLSNKLHPKKESKAALQNSTVNMYIDEQIRVLTLNDNEHQDSTLYRIEKNWIIQFRLGPSLLGRKVHLYTNYPEHINVEFKRTRYQLLKWQQDEGCKNADDTASYAEIIVKMAGSFHFYFTYEDA